jgi:hypothetical protein
MAAASARAVAVAFGGAGEAVEEVDLLGDLEGAELGPAVLLQAAFRGVLAGLEDDGGVDLDKPPAPGACLPWAPWPAWQLLRSAAGMSTAPGPPRRQQSRSTSDDNHRVHDSASSQPDS